MRLYQQGPRVGLVIASAIGQINGVTSMSVIGNPVSARFEGAATVSGIGAAIVPTVGAITGQASLLGIGPGIVTAVAGVASVSGVAASTAVAVGTVVGRALVAPDLINIDLSVLLQIVLVGTHANPIELEGLHEPAIYLIGGA